MLSDQEGPVIKNNFYAHPAAIIEEGCNVGEGTNIWAFSSIMKGASIGSFCIIGQHVMVAGGAVIGNRVKIQNNVSVYDGVICEDEVFVGPSVVFTNVINPRSAIERKNEFRPTTIKRGATIGANATIICGHCIGEFAFVGAGSVITRDVPPYALVVGNPARQSGWVSEFGHKLEFVAGIATCPESQQRYSLENARIQRL